MNILLFGPPGAGKGTQSALLVEKLNMKHVSTGDLFRAAIKNGTELGKKAKGYMDAGQYVPDEIVLGMVGEVFEDLGESGFILDGFPRTTPQAIGLEKLTKQFGLSIDKVVFLEVPREVLVKRLTGRRVCKNCGATYHVDSLPPKVPGVCDQCGKETLYQRSDDSEGVVGTRLETYDKSTTPLKEFYRLKGLLKEINGLGTTEEVFDRLGSVLKR